MGCFCASGLGEVASSDVDVVLKPFTAPYIKPLLVFIFNTPFFLISGPILTQYSIVVNGMKAIFSFFHSLFMGGYYLYIM